MFTGIITHIGKVKAIVDATFSFAADKSLIKQLTKGESISVNGVCLTAEDIYPTSFSTTIMPETQKKTMLQSLKQNDIVNLELPLTPQSLVSGHIVQGHVDAVGTISDIQEEGNSRILTIDIPEHLQNYIVAKGSITVNGISLTVISVTHTSFTVGIIPYTWEHTMLQTIKIGEKVNLETDILAKYIEKLLKKENV